VNCLSWSFDSINLTCSLKRSFRSNPVLRANFYSGFKPSGLFAIGITRGLEFRKINNPIYSILSKQYNRLNTTEQYLYDFLVLDLENQVLICSTDFVMLLLLLLHFNTKKLKDINRFINWKQYRFSNKNKHYKYGL
jgi:hypothetical protein